MSEQAVDAEKGGYRIVNVEYTDQQHDECIAPTFAEIKRQIDLGALRPEPGAAARILDSRPAQEIDAEVAAAHDAYNTLRRKLLYLVGDLFRLKGRSFLEEKEWRLLTYTLGDGTADKKFRLSGNTILPYESFEFTELARGPIREVILGARNPTPAAIVKRFLRVNGFENVEVRPSEASYR